MHILLGKYKNRRIESMQSPRVRPTARRIRESLFRFLGSRVEGASFLDLYAGSGAVGLEALSRGAAHVTFVDRTARMCRYIELNLKRCEVDEEQSTLVQSDAIDFLHDSLARRGAQWDIAFVDPPYSTDCSPALALFGSQALLQRATGIVTVEHHCEKQLPEAVGRLRRWRVVRHGESCLSFYERK